MILLIDTSQETGYAALALDGKILFSEENPNAKEHAAWLHMAINRILELANSSLRDLQAIAVVAGPGCYTGLRVGMAAAKGFCYALKIPLITLNTLRVMAESMVETAQEKNALICPLIDARRDEVFTALFQASVSSGQRPTANGQQLTNSQLPSANILIPPQALIFDKNSFETELLENFIIFFGSGAAKWEKICPSDRAIFLPQPNLIQAFAGLAHLEFLAANWADPVYSEPVYLKEFFTY